MALLSISVILCVIDLYVKGYNRLYSTMYMYILFGFIFEILFIAPDNFNEQKSIYFYHIIFPLSLTISIFMRTFGKFYFFIILYSFFSMILSFIMNYNDFVSLNYLISIFGMLILLLRLSRNNQIKFFNVIDALIALNLYFMSITFILLKKVQFWQVSKYLPYMHNCVTFLLFLTLILINVKFWRSLTH